MGTCSICGNTNVDTISGVCGNCIGRNRRQTRQKKNAIKGIVVAIICVIGFYGLLQLSSLGILQQLAKVTSEKISETTKELENRGSEVTKQLKPKPQSPDIQPSKPTEPESNPPIIQSKPKIVISELEQKIHLLINEERGKRGLTSINYDYSLAEAARMHSQDMVNRNYFEHDSPDGQTFSDRYSRVGLDCQTPISSTMYSAGSENIFQGNLYDSISYLNGIPVSYDWNDMDRLAYQTVNGWMHSSGHRDNIIKPYHIAEGIGVAIANDDKVYVTQDFC